LVRGHAPPTLQLVALRRHLAWVLPPFEQGDFARFDLPPQPVADEESTGSHPNLLATPVGPRPFPVTPSRPSSGLPGAPTVSGAARYATSTSTARDPSSDQTPPAAVALSGCSATWDAGSMSVTIHKSAADGPAPTAGTRTTSTSTQSRSVTGGIPRVRVVNLKTGFEHHRVGVSGRVVSRSPRGVGVSRLPPVGLADQGPNSPRPHLSAGLTGGRGRSGPGRRSLMLANPKWLARKIVAAIR
jgi:hypothetical protein